jgi:hypothetical protein
MLYSHQRSLHSANLFLAEANRIHGKLKAEVGLTAGFILATPFNSKLKLFSNPVARKVIFELVRLGEACR